jgi:hypothetical protein
MRTIKQQDQFYRAARRSNQLRQDVNDERETLAVIVLCLLIGLIGGIDIALGFILGVIVIAALQLLDSRTGGAE